MSMNSVAENKDAVSGQAANVWSVGRLTTLVVLLIAIAIPFVVKNFLIFQLTLMIIYAIAIIGLNLLTGINGQFSLGMAHSMRSGPIPRPS